LLFDAGSGSGQHAPVMQVLVFALDGPPAVAVPEGSALIRVASAGALVEALRRPADGAVLVSDGLPPAWLPMAVAAVRGAKYPVVEVTGNRWDGVSHSPLTAACRGIVAGFPSAAAIREAVTAVRRLAAEAG